jgi:hypothetical protein
MVFLPFVSAKGRRKQSCRNVVLRLKIESASLRAITRKECANAARKPIERKHRSPDAKV